MCLPTWRPTYSHKYGHKGGFWSFKFRRHPVGGPVRWGRSCCPKSASESRYAWNPLRIFAILKILLASTETAQTHTGKYFSGRSLHMTLLLHMWVSYMHGACEYFLETRWNVSLLHSPVSTPPAAWSGLLQEALHPLMVLFKFVLWYYAYGEISKFAWANILVM